MCYKQQQELTGKIFEIKRFSIHDGPGIRTTVFFKGCPLACKWCHNPEGISAKPEIAFVEKKCAVCGACVDACPNGAQHIDREGKRLFDRQRCTICGKCTDACYPQALLLYGTDVTVDYLMDEISADKDFYKNSGGGVTLSGGEPLLQAEFCEVLLKCCKAAGIDTAVDTSGYVRWEAIQKVLDHTDLFLYDLKHMDSGMHARYTGVPNQRILDNLKRLGSYDKPVEIRIPIIPDVNNSRDNICRTAEFLCGIRSLTVIKLLRYHSMARSKFAAVGRMDTMPQVESPTEEEMVRISEWFGEYGLTAVI
jgi:pyruvate formate lyase activating enzyme